MVNPNKEAAQTFCEREPDQHRQERVKGAFSLDANAQN
jgi:hypothetical protein